MNLKFKSSTAALPLEAPHTYETEGDFNAPIELLRHDKADNTVQISVTGMWFASDDLRSAAQLFINLANHLEASK